MNFKNKLEDTKAEIFKIENRFTEIRKEIDKLNEEAKGLEIYGNQLIGKCQILEELSKETEETSNENKTVS